jgi:hypothetical protein
MSVVSAGLRIISAIRTFGGVVDPSYQNSPEPMMSEPSAVWIIANGERRYRKLG